MSARWEDVSRANAIFQLDSKPHLSTQYTTGRFNSYSDLGGGIQKEQHLCRQDPVVHMVRIVLLRSMPARVRLISPATAASTKSDNGRLPANLQIKILHCYIQNWSELGVAGSLQAGVYTYQAAGHFRNIYGLSALAYDASLLGPI